MNLNHIQTVAKYESKIFAKLALLDYGRFVACRDIGRIFSLMDLWNGRHWPRMSRGLEIISMPSYRRSS